MPQKLCRQVSRGYSKLFSTLKSYNSQKGRDKTKFPELTENLFNFASNKLIYN